MRGGTITTGVTTASSGSNSEAVPSLGNRRAMLPQLDSAYKWHISATSLPLAVSVCLHSNFADGNLKVPNDRIQGHPRSSLSESG